MFEIGQILTKENYTQAAIWCNKNGAHIEKQGAEYVIAVNPPPAEPTVQQRRELVLAEKSGASDYVRKQAQEIEALAAPLREAEQ